MRSDAARALLDAFCLLAAAALLALAVCRGRLESNVVLSALICIVPVALRRLRVLNLPAPLTVMVVLSPWFHSLGLVMGYYGIVGNYDTFTHTLSSAVVAVLLFYALVCAQSLSGGSLDFSGRGMMVMTAVLAMTFSVYWEVLEYGSDVLLGSRTQYSPYDTLTDLLCDTVGTAIGSAWAGASMGRRGSDEVLDDLCSGMRTARLIRRGRSPAPPLLGVDPVVVDPVYPGEHPGGEPSEPPELMARHDGHLGAEVRLPRPPRAEVVADMADVHLPVGVLQQIHEDLPSAMLEIVPMGLDLRLEDAASDGEQPAHEVARGLLPVDPEREAAERVPAVGPYGPPQSHGAPAVPRPYAYVRSRVHLLYQAADGRDGMLEVAVHAQGVVGIRDREPLEDGCSQPSVAWIPDHDLGQRVAEPLHLRPREVRGSVVHEDDAAAGVRSAYRSRHLGRVPLLVERRDDDGHGSGHGDVDACDG